MDDAQIHSSIEQLVAEEHELWERGAAGTATDEDGAGSRRSSSRSTSSGICFASDVPSVSPVVIPTWPTCGRRTSSRATSSSVNFVSRGFRGRKRDVDADPVASRPAST